MVDENDKEFEEVWESADWVFKKDKQDARYFWLKGRQYELTKRQSDLSSLIDEVKQSK